MVREFVKFVLKELLALGVMALLLLLVWYARSIANPTATINGGSPTLLGDFMVCVMLLSAFGISVTFVVMLFGIPDGYRDRRREIRERRTNIQTDSKGPKVLKCYP